MTFALLAPLALVAHRGLAGRLGWARWPTLGVLLSLAVVLTLTLPPEPGVPIGGPGLSGLGACTGSLFDPGVLGRGLIATTERGERVGNVLMFVPLTFFAVYASRRPALVATVGVVLPVAIELTQSIEGVGRECVGYDWVNNAIGAVAGVLLAMAVIRLRDVVGESPPR
ncbi:VanZ family protein [Phytohabitans rumicis]|uniref:VanZ family protein n=1 Tax=Phytohabitans rumicis TaxID=1076125 RepID=UPI001566167C|nr:VanZ family protein [Phytohabitans rumicis]